MTDPKLPMIKMKYMRLCAGLSMSEVARRARMGAGDIGKIESGRLTPYDSQLRKIAVALGVNECNATSLLDIVKISDVTS